jgi:hypothetical protein
MSDRRVGIKRIVAFASILLLTAIACGGGGKNLSGCLDATVDSLESTFSYVNVHGTVRNTCAEEVTYARVGAICYDTADEVVATDTEIIENLAAGQSRAFALVSGRSAAIAHCSVDVIGAR